MKHEPLFKVLTEIVEGICHRHLDDLKVFPDNIRNVETLVVLPHSADYPRLVGRHGSCVHAAEYLVNTAAVRLGTRLKYSLIESFVGDREPIEAFVFNPDFDVATFHLRLERLAESVSGKPWKFKITPMGEMLFASVDCVRDRTVETFLSSIEAVFKPYCYGSGRKLQLKPQFTNHDSTDHILCRGNS